MRAEGIVLEGPIGGALLRLAAPVILGEALHTAFHIVDIAWVGALGARATGAIVTSMFSLWIVFSVANLVVIGLGAHVSRAIGAGDRDQAAHVVIQGMWLCAGISVFGSLLVGFGARPLFELLGTDPIVSQAGVAYLRIIALGLPFAYIYLACGAVMRACGNTVVPMKITGAAVVANVILDPFLIYGWGPFPRLEVAGSAVATVICMAGGVAMFAVLAARGHRDLPLRLRPIQKPDRVMILSIARVGAPYCAIGILFSAVYLWYARIAAFFGEVPLAILGIGNRLESITYLTADGFAVAASAFVGQNLGAGDARRAERGAWSAAWMMSGVGALVGVVMLLVPEPLLFIFTREPEAISAGVPYVRILALCQIFTGLEGAIGGGFAGAGDTFPPMVIHVVFAVGRFPLASWAAFGLGLGLYGIAWTMTLTCIVRAVILALWFRRGAWKARELPGSRRPLPPAEEPEPTGL